LEKSLKLGNVISGLFVQGHVDTTSKLKIKRIVFNIYMLLTVIEYYYL